jgi:hypothetical protein
VFQNNKIINGLYKDPQQELLEAYSPIFKFVLQFRNNLENIFFMIDDIKEEDYHQIAELLCLHFYENILLCNPFHNEILLIIHYLLSKEIEQLNSPSLSSFLDNSFLSILFKTLTQRREIKSYLNLIFHDIISYMEKHILNFLELDLSKIYENIKMNQTKDITPKNFKFDLKENYFNLDKTSFLLEGLSKTKLFTVRENENPVSDYKIKLTNEYFIRKLQKDFNNMDDTTKQFCKHFLYN